VEAKAFVLATGSEATRPQALHDALGDKLITTDELFYLDALPRSLAVVGLGPIGLEMGLALSRLGSQVVGSNRSRRIGLMEDPEVNSAALDYWQAVSHGVRGAGDGAAPQRRAGGLSGRGRAGPGGLGAGCDRPRATDPGAGAGAGRCAFRRQGPFALGRGHAAGAGRAHVPGRR
jgi:hypothetical protein